MRLRIFDWGNRWFWVVIFYKPNAYGESYFSMELYNPSPSMRWIHIWHWENVPNIQGEGEEEGVTL